MLLGPGCRGIYNVSPNLSSVSASAQRVRRVTGAGVGVFVGTQEAGSLCESRRWGPLSVDDQFLRTDPLGVKVPGCGLLCFISENPD